jgi:hypothetical protein
MSLDELTKMFIVSLSVSALICPTYVVVFSPQWLFFPAIFGLLLVVTQFREASLDAPLVPIYAVALGVWATVMIEFWKRRCAELAYRWGVLGYEHDSEKVRRAAQWRQHNLSRDLILP